MEIEPELGPRACVATEKGIERRVQLEGCAYVAVCSDANEEDGKRAEGS